VFCHPGETVKCRTGLLPGIDVKADGGYIIAAPSNHKAGGTYQWTVGPFEATAADLPDYLCDLLLAPPQAARQSPRSSTAASRDNLLRRAQGYIAKADSATEGKRNHSAFSLAGHLAAFEDGGDRLTEGEVLALMSPWNLRNCPPLDEAELGRAVGSAMVNGTPRAMKQGDSPRGLPDLRPEHEKQKRSDDPWPEPLKDEAYYGLVGDIVRTIEPHSEADPAALLVQTLVAVGNVIGRNAHFRAESDLHFTNLFTCLVGQTSKGRKGSSWGHVGRLLSMVDETWRKEHVVNGLSSG
jgi:hypothetical protein